MVLNKQNVLFISRSTQHGGTENVIMQLVEILYPLVNKVVVCTADGFDTSLLDKLGVKHYMIPDIQDKSPSTVLKSIMIMKRIVKEEKITVIHSHHRMASFYVEMLFGKNIVKIANAHNTFVDKRRLTCFAYRNTHLIAVGERVKENLIEVYGLPKEQVTVIHNAIKPFKEKVTLINELYEAKSEGYVIIGNIGRLTKQKGMSYFIKATAKVVGICPKIKIFIVGDGEESEELKHLAGDLVPKENVMFMGYRNDIQNVISQMDFIVLSSLWEGLPLTPIEAFSVGIPVIATAIDGTPEIIENNKTGLLVKARDVDDLAQAMIQFINNESERKRLGENAYSRYKEEFSLNKMAERYVDYYKKI